MNARRLAELHRAQARLSMQIAAELDGQDDAEGLVLDERPAGIDLPPPPKSKPKRKARAIPTPSGPVDELASRRAANLLRQNGFLVEKK